MQIDYGEEMGMKLKNNSNQRTLKAGAKGVLFKDREESKGSDIQGAAGRWLAAIDKVIGR